MVEVWQVRQSLFRYRWTWKREVNRRHDHAITVADRPPHGDKAYENVALADFVAAIDQADPASLARHDFELPLVGKLMDDDIGALAADADRGGELAERRRIAPLGKIDFDEPERS
jgi:hypothetical protein